MRLCCPNCSLLKASPPTLQLHQFNSWEHPHHRLNSLHQLYPLILFHSFTPFIHSTPIQYIHQFRYMHLCAPYSYDLMRTYIGRKMAAIPWLLVGFVSILPVFWHFKVLKGLYSYCLFTTIVRFFKPNFAQRK